MKKCKGLHKDTYGLGCGKLQEKRKLGLGMECGCYTDFLFNTEAGKKRVEKATLKATKPRRELAKAESEHNNRKRLPEALKQTQIVFNEYIRLRDKYKPCISSENPWKPDFDAGHLFTVKQYSELRFDEDNCHGQSIGENRFKEGNFEDYLINLPNRIGKERTEALIKRAEESKKRVYKWTLEEVERIKSTYKAKIKHLKNND